MARKTLLKTIAKKERDFSSTEIKGRRISQHWAWCRGPGGQEIGHCE